MGYFGSLLHFKYFGTSSRAYVLDDLLIDSGSKILFLQATVVANLKPPISINVKAKSSNILSAIHTFSMLKYNK
jgi:hypothetical protein